MSAVVDTLSVDSSAQVYSRSEVRIPTEAELLEDGAQSADSFFTCPYPNCSAKCRRKCALALHIHKVHSPGSTEKRKEIVYHCPVSDCRYSVTNSDRRYFDSLKHLKQHYAKIHKGKRYVCDRCQKHFALKCDFERHMRECGEEFVCDDCGVKYTLRGSLFTHCSRNGHRLPERYEFFAKRAPAADRSKTNRISRPSSIGSNKCGKIPLARERRFVRPATESTPQLTANSSITLLVPFSAVQNAIDSALSTPAMGSNSVDQASRNCDRAISPIQSNFFLKQLDSAARLCNSNTQTSERYVSIRQPRVVHDIAVSTQINSDGVASNWVNAATQAHFSPIAPSRLFPQPSQKRIDAQAQYQCTSMPVHAVDSASYNQLTNSASQTNESDELDAIIASLVRSCETQTHSSYIQNQHFASSFAGDICTIIDDAPTKLRCRTIQTDADAVSFSRPKDPPPIRLAGPNNFGGAHAGVQTVDSAFEQDFASCATQTARATYVDASASAFDEVDDEFMRCWFTESANQQLDALSGLANSQSSVSVGVSSARFVRESEAQTTLQCGSRLPMVTHLDRCLGVLETPPQIHAQLNGVMQSTCVGETQTLFEYFDLLDTATQTEKF